MGSRKMEYDNAKNPKGEKGKTKANEKQTKIMQGSQTPQSSLPTQY